MQDNNQITYFAETDARNQRVPFGIKALDRTQHVYVIGKTGVGKSTLLENMVVQDINNGNGFAFIDPHGKTADLLLEYIPPERVKDVLYFAPFDMEYPVSFNVMEDVGYDKRHLVVSGLMSTFKKIWEDAWSARMEYILSNTLLALLEYPDATLLSVNKMLSDKAYRKKVVDNVTDVSVKSFWVDEFAKYTERMAAEAVPAIQNKIGQFTANPIIRNIIGQPKSSFDIRDLMDDQKIMIINLSKGRVGEANANLLGSMLITKIYLSAMSRADTSGSDLDALPNFYLYVDEFQNFANESFADILSEARKYKLNLTVAHQYIEQMTDEVRAAVFGNVGTMITFRVGATDAEALEKEFAPEIEMQDIVNLGRFQIYLRLMIDSVGSHPFSATTLPPLEKPEVSSVENIIASSREQFANPRAEVDETVQRLIQGEPENQGGGQGKPNNQNAQVGGAKPSYNQKPQGDQGGGAKPSYNQKPSYSQKPQGDQGGGAKPSYNQKPQDSGQKQNDSTENRKPVLDQNAQKEINAFLKEKEEVKKNMMNEVKGVPMEDESMSLRTLKSDSKKFDNKSASPEHKNELQSALAGIIGTIEKNEKKEVKSKSVAPKVEKKDVPVSVKQSDPAPKPETENIQNIESPKEIPEKELREVLDVTKE
jgi:hypothetical protein